MHGPLSMSPAWSTGGLSANGPSPRVEGGERGSVTMSFEQARMVSRVLEAEIQLADASDEWLKLKAIALDPDAGLREDVCRLVGSLGPVFLLTQHKEFERVLDAVKSVLLELVSEFESPSL